MPAVDHASRDHATFNPSGSKEWLNCALVKWLDLNGHAPPEEAGEHDYNVFGTLCHEESEDFIESWKSFDDLKPYTLERDYNDAKTGKKQSMCIPFDEWMEHVQPYVQAIRDCYEELDFDGLNPQITIEQKVGIIGGDCFGTYDCLIVSDGALHMFDLKTGRGLVKASSKQFGLYFIGVLKKLFPKGNPGNIRIYSHIYQHHGEGHTFYEWTVDELNALEKDAKSMIRKAKAKKEPKPTPDEHGEAQCKYCKQYDKCPAQAAKTTKALSALTVLPEKPKDKVAVLKQVKIMTPDQRAFIINNYDIIKAVMDGVKSHELAAQQDGNGDPRFKLVNARTSRKWRSDLTEEEIAEELDFQGVAPYEAKLRALTKIEADGGDVSALVEKPEPGPKLVRADAKGTPYASRTSQAMEVLDDDLGDL